MIEVFRTNVVSHEQAIKVIDCLRHTFAEYVVNFDLDDCDKILRVKCCTETVQSSVLINVLKSLGVYAEVLEEDYSHDDVVEMEKNTDGTQNFAYHQYSFSAKSHLI